MIMVITGDVKIVFRTMIVNKDNQATLKRPKDNTRGARTC